MNEDDDTCSWHGDEMDETVLVGELKAHLKKAEQQIYQLEKELSFAEQTIKFLRGEISSMIFWSSKFAPEKEI